MRWKTFQKGESPFAIAGLILISPFLLGIFVFAATIIGIVKTKRFIVGPREYWSKWFAWFPVRVQTEEGRVESVWLEMIERRSEGTMEDTYYRLPVPQRDILI
jgi:hypothetical protein